MWTLKKRRTTSLANSWGLMICQMRKIWKGQRRLRSKHPLTGILMSRG